MDALRRGSNEEHGAQPLAGVGIAVFATRNFATVGLGCWRVQRLLGQAKLSDSLMCLICFVFFVRPSSACARARALLCVDYYAFRVYDRPVPWGGL